MLLSPVKVKSQIISDESFVSMIVRFYEEVGSLYFGADLRFPVSYGRQVKTSVLRNHCFEHLDHT